MIVHIIQFPLFYKHKPSYDHHTHRTHTIANTSNVNMAFYVCFSFFFCFKFFLEVFWCIWIGRKVKFIFCLYSNVMCFISMVYGLCQKRVRNRKGKISSSSAKQMHRLNTTVSESMKIAKDLLKQSKWKKQVNVNLSPSWILQKKKKENRWFIAPWLHRSLKLCTICICCWPCYVYRIYV